MNKFEALIACRNHWQWLAITGSHIKQDYYPSIVWNENCACCEYAYWGKLNINHCLPCNNCPLNGFAWEHALCLSSFSLYRHWEKSKSYGERIYNALRMVYACNQAIEDMIINGEV